MNISEEKIRNQTKRPNNKRHEKSLLKEFSGEIMIGTLLFIIVLFIIEDSGIKNTIIQRISFLSRSIEQRLIQVFDGSIAVISKIGIGDMLGGILGTASVIIVFMRIRKKIILRYNELSYCPECGEKLYLIHRSSPQRFVSKIFRLKMHRFKCKKCAFNGVRIRHFHSR